MNLNLKNIFSRHNANYLIIWMMSFLILLGFSIVVAHFLKIENYKESYTAKLKNFDSKIGERINSNLDYLKELAKSQEIKDIITNHTQTDTVNKTALNITKQLFSADIVYILNKKGTVTASTEYEKGKTLLDNNYSFRPYFQRSIQGESTITGALGITTQSRGIYLSTPIYTNNDSIGGVLVLKMGLDKIDQLLSEFSSPSVIVTQEKIIFATNQSGWLFKSIQKLTSTDKETLSKNKQFTNIHLQVLPYQLENEEVYINNRAYITIKQPFIIDNWHIINTLDLKNIPALPVHQLALIFLAFFTSLIFATIIILLLGTIKKKNKYENNLKLSESKYKTLVENSGTPITYYSSKGKIIFINDAGASILNSSPQDIIGKTVNELYQDNAKIILERLANVIATQNRNYFEDTFTVNNRSVIFNSYYQPVIDESGIVIAIQVVSQDITDYKKSENEAFIFQKFAEEAGQGFLICDLEGIITYANKAFTSIVQEDYQNILKRNIELFYSYQDSIALKKIINSDLNDSSHKSLELPLKTKHGKQIPTIQNLFFLKNKFDKIKHVGIVYTNITERKLIEEKLKTKTKEIHKQYEIYRNLNKELKEQNEIIEKINNELSLANKKVKEADELKSAFLANMSHELRSPINNIVGFSQILSEDAVEYSDKSEYRNIIEKNAEQLQTLISDIIDISKIEAKQIQVQHNPCNLNEIFHDIKVLYNIKFKDSGITFNISKGLSDENAQILTDENRLRQILDNLINNAFKYTIEGSVDVSYTLVSGNKIRFSIKDSGIGIKPGHENVIFDRYRQAHDEIHPKINGGTGLGLAICKGLIENLEGKIWYNSVIGKGTTFFFEIPYSPAIEDKASQASADSANDYQWNNKSILIVEDDDFNILFMTRILEKAGLSITLAKNGVDAIKLICEEKNNFDAILMDMNLPVKDGFQTTREIRDNNYNIPIIAQTAYAMAGDKEKCIAAGCNDYITKPIKRTELLSTLSRYIS